MDGFGDNFVPNGETNGTAAAAAAVDPAAEFLAREQSDLAGIEDPPVIVEGMCIVGAFLSWLRY